MGFRKKVSVPVFSTFSLLILVVSIIVFIIPDTLAETNAEMYRDAGLMFSGPYFGQSPPGLTPERFAAGIVPADIMGCPVFTEDGLEAYWSILPGGHIWTSSEDGGNWTTPVNAPFLSGLSGSDFPCLSPDGQKMFFTSLSDPGPGLQQKENIWVIEREGDGWGSPSPLPATVNGGHLHWQVSVANNGNLYFQSLGPNGGDIHVSEFTDGEYQPPQPLPAEINTLAFEMGPFIAPDESYIIFSRFDEISNPFPDLYISFRKADGNWTEAAAMDALNNPTMDEVCPNVTRDGQYLIYLSSLGGGTRSYWVSAEIIELYRPICCEGTPGNVDGDAGVELNLMDILLLISHLYDDPPAPLDLICSGDANCDCDLNLLDILTLIDKIYNNGDDLCTCDFWFTACE